MGHIPMLHMGKLRLGELKGLRKSCRDRASEGLMLLAGQGLKWLQRRLAVYTKCTFSGPAPQRSVLTVSSGDCDARPSLRSTDGYLRSLGIWLNCGLCSRPRWGPGFCIANPLLNNASAVGPDSTVGSLGEMHIPQPSPRV